MDEFSKLSLADPSTTVQEEDLQAILSLNICEDDSKPIGNKALLSQKIMDKFMPHVPSSPSPLRQAVLVDEIHDEMDIDAKEESDTERSEMNSAFIENDLLHESEAEEEEPAQTASPNSKAVIKALLSPTKLGVAAATKLDDYSSESSVPAATPATDGQASHLQKSTEITGVELPQETLETLRQRSQYSPIQISINNNHYYYPPESQYIEESGIRKRSLKLPDPWSPQSHPASRGSYLFTSYLQIFLNLLTALICFSFVMIFMRAIKADLRSEWQTTKLELVHESLQCRIHYNANKCERATRVPALEKQCDDWEKCMGRNNELFFRARSAISARLIGDTLNSFIEPLGWKTHVSYRELYDWTMDEIVACAGVRNSCTYCGVFRRQALDRGAAKLGIRHVVTGHNADDMAETVLMNILRGDVARLEKSTAIMTQSSGSPIKRSKPFKYSYQKEIVLYAHYKKLDYFSTECTYAPEAFRGTARELMKNLEAVRPSCIIDIIYSGESLRLKPKRTKRAPPAGHVEVRSDGSVSLNGGNFVDGNRCERCGYLSSNRICKACMLLEGLQQNRAKLSIDRDVSTHGAARLTRTLEQLTF